jgi:16S rRNA (cytosine967-C5)-methyltransferase
MAKFSGVRRPKPRQAAPSRLDGLAQLLQKLSTFSAPMDMALSQAFRDEARLGSSARFFLAESAYAAVRHWSALCDLLAASDFRLGPDPAASTAWRRMAMLAASLAVGYDRIVSELTEGERAWLTHATAEFEALVPPQSLSLPDWIWQSWLTQFGQDEAIALGQACLTPAALDTRVNRTKATVKEVVQALAQAGVAVQVSPEVPGAIRLEGRPALSQLEAFQQGWFEVQDLGSQLLARLLNPARGEFVVDFCAGAGGKTLALGDLMRNTGRLYAFDTATNRLARLKPRLARSGLSNVWPVAIAHERDDRVKRLRGKAQAVLVDAPCSGMGTLRRNPDLKWRQSPDSLAQLIATQRQILDAACRLCAPGGRLVYATCSVDSRENEDQVDWFLAEHPEFERMDSQAALRGAGVELPAGWQAFNDKGDLRLMPNRSNTDGFFGVLLTKKDPQRVNPVGQ